MGYAAKAKQVLAERRGGPFSPPTHREESEISEERGIGRARATEVVEERATPHHAESEGIAPDLEALSLEGDAIGALVERVLALSREERAAWRREVIHAAVWAAAGKRADPHLLADLRVLRRVEAAGSCLRCGDSCPPDGRLWCEKCRERYVSATEDKMT